MFRAVQTRIRYRKPTVHCSQGSRRQGSAYTLGTWHC